MVAIVTDKSDKIVLPISVISLQQVNV